MPELRGALLEQHLVASDFHRRNVGDAHCFEHICRKDGGHRPAQPHLHRDHFVGDTSASDHDPREHQAVASRGSHRTPQQHGEIGDQHEEEPNREDWMHFVNGRGTVNDLDKQPVGRGAALEQEELLQPHCECEQRPQAARCMRAVATVEGDRATDPVAPDGGPRRACSTSSRAVPRCSCRAWPRCTRWVETESSG